MPRELREWVQEPPEHGRGYCDLGPAEALVLPHTGDWAGTEDGRLRPHVPALSPPRQPARLQTCHPIAGGVVVGGVVVGTRLGRPNSACSWRLSSHSQPCTSLVLPAT